ncbi:hypothetical protein ACX80W_04595 [Arthrobacter sp. TMN-37]
MGKLFEDLVSTSYSQLYLLSGGAELVHPAEAFVGQNNGLCGGSVDGAAFLVTGTHTGLIPVCVQLLDTAPPLGDWEEIVEISFRPHGVRTGLYGWAENASFVFDLPDPSYRLRWSASGMDEGKAQDVATEERPAPDRYEISFWPAPYAPDTILRSTSRNAQYWQRSGFIS